MELQLEENRVPSLRSCSKNIYEPSVAVLSEGIVNTYEPSLKHVRKHLNELVREQDEVLTKIHTENLHLAEVQHSEELQEMFAKVKTYSNKLHGAKKDMKLLHDRSTKLKKRAERLQQLSEKQSISKPKEPIIP